MTEDEMVGWHHWLNGNGFEQTQGDGDGQGSPACCGSWGCKELDVTQRLNNSSHCASGSYGLIGSEGRGIV